MSNQNDEVERLRHLRDRQIRLRDPKAYDRKVQHKISSRYKVEKLTVDRVIQDIPGKWMGTILGAILGIIFAIAFNLLVESEAFWIEYVGYFLVALCAILGRGLGAAMDWRDEDHEALVNHK
jgi:hypothetical protein